jgi:DNA-binding HxlR family transcriptional regulator
MARRTSFAGMNCSVAQTLEIVGEWWTVLILRDAFFGVNRFDQFQERLGIARNVLTDRLGRLVDHGILERTAYQAHPVRHEYRLTAKGRDLWPVLVAIRQWGDAWAAPHGPPVELVHSTCGRVATARPTCSACGELIDPATIRSRPGPGASDPRSLPVSRSSS